MLTRTLSEGQEELDRRKEEKKSHRVRARRLALSLCVTWPEALVPEHLQGTLRGQHGPPLELPRNDL